MLPRFLNTQIVWVEKTPDLNHDEYGYLTNEALQYKKGGK
jgi:hypothetical protein